MINSRKKYPNPTSWWQKTFCYLYYFSSVDLLNYAMTKRYLEDIDFMLTTDKQIRFAKRQGRLYLDIDLGSTNSW